MNRIERDRFITYIGQTYNNIQIWGQYERMVDFLFDEYPKTKRRFDEIAQPFLFLLSHVIELALKENIKFFEQYVKSKQLTKFDNWTNLLKSHDLKALSDEFKIYFFRFHKQVKASREDKDKFNKYYKILEKLNVILERNAETYRYSEKLDNNGKTVKSSIKSNKKIDLIEVKSMFDDLKNLFIGAPNAMGIYTDYIDYKKNNPEYNKGKGKLYCQRLPYTEHFLENVKEKLTKDLKKVSENMWMNPENCCNYEVQVWNNDIYIIEI
ncbi:hypothetical protein [Chishuiella sp.]|uniref:hypothetical protein n=1 Tax=Chishuiella sp. TaxID=1969467 RepID=UPI0028AA2818|nr:hypothetical protein [Chishuiella sp.]